MSDRKFGRIIFAVAVLFTFFSFALYADFYRTASSLIGRSVEKALIWNSLLDRQIETQQHPANRR